MMNIILFGGNSQRNKQWIHEVGEKLSPLFGTTLVHDYSHWDSKGSFIDFGAELAKIGPEVKGLDHYAVFAKSVGTILALQAIAQGLLKPDKCIFAGVPIGLAEKGGIPLQTLLKDCPVPLLFLQNTDDPIASYAQLTAYVHDSGATHYKCIELPGDTHDYDDLDQLKNLVGSFVNG